METWAWMQYEAYDEKYELYAVCGNGASSNVNFSLFDMSCTRATISCGSDLGCVRDTMVQKAQSGQYAFCPGRFNLLINPNPGAVGWYGHGDIYI